MKIAVLGAGMVGRAIAWDLARAYAVTVFDLNGMNLEAVKQRNPDIQVVAADLSQFTEYKDWLIPFDLVVTAVPGFMGYKTLEAVIRSGKDVVDISFFPEDALELDQLAIEKNVTVITDCGVAPGLSNLTIGYYNSLMKIDAFEIYVGGLPKERKPPFQYKAPFSPVDVIQEYIRPVRLVEKGSVVTKPALSDREIIHFSPVGDLEAFNTDGLRSLVNTMKQIPEMKEKTLRYPGHIDLIIALQQAGFFSTTPLTVGESTVMPLDFTSKLLVEEWKLGAEEAEFTVMLVNIYGEGKTIRYRLFDEYDPATRIASMSRTTGYTCTAAVNLVLKNLFRKKGVFPPELVGADKNCFEFIVAYLRERGVRWEISNE